MTIAVKFCEDDIPYGLAFDAYRGTSFTPEKRAKREQEDYVEVMRSNLEALEPLADTEEKRAYLAEQFGRFRQGYIKRLTAYLSSKSRCMSTLITGPANFPVARNQKRLDVAHRRLNELIEYKNKVLEKMRRELAGSSSISSDDPDAIEKLRAKLDELESAQIKMKNANKILRLKGVDDDWRIERLCDMCGMSREDALKTMRPDVGGGTGFPHYKLSNNLANIRRIKSRIVEIEHRRKCVTKELGFPGGSIVDNTEENRVQIFFDSKPGVDVRTALKKHGFRWAPSVGAWQRMRSYDAREYALSICKSFYGIGE